MMLPVPEDTGPVYRATRANRAIASVVVAAALAAIVWAIATDGSPLKVVGLTAVGAVVGFLAFSAMRFEVRAEPEHLVVCGGVRRRRIPWAQIRSFGIGGPKGKDVYVELTDKRRHRLPVVDITNQQTSPTEVRDALQRYWRSHRR
jgi:PH (Pleckstrin Homology) domain-containing protein